MKKVLILGLIFFAQSGLADFLSASDAYENKAYAKAYKEFKELAVIGNKRAQYNLAVMHLRGEGVAEDITEAYAWAKLAQTEEHPEFQDSLDYIANGLSAEELKVANLKAEELNNRYGDDQIYIEFSPIVYADATDKGRTKPKYKLTPIKREQPTYPRQMAIDRVQGWLTVHFEVYPNGLVRNPRIIDSFPEGAFDKAGIHALSKWKFEVTYEEGIEPYPVPATQTIQFLLKVPRLLKPFSQVYAERLEEIKEYADGGNPDAQYIYAVASSASGMLEKGQRMAPEETNKWLLKSAQNGNIDAQYLLGKNILFGKGCKVEKQKGLFWVSMAAENGNDLASRHTYELLKSDNYINNTGKSEVQWLAESAGAGNPDSMLEWAKLVAYADDSSPADLKLARKYLKKNLRERRKSVDWYLASAELYRQDNNFKKAEKESKKARRLERL